MMITEEESSFKALFDNFTKEGVVVWIGVRTASKVPMIVKEEVNAVPGGLEADRSNKGVLMGKRHVTIIQKEHIDAVGAFLGKQNIDPALLRRNIVVEGINLNALKARQFKIGDALLEMTGFCYPCSQMETNLGPGGFNAMRGHGGITCRVIEGGMIKIGSRLSIS